MVQWFRRYRGFPIRLTLAGMVLAGTLLAGSGCSSSKGESSLSALHYFKTGNAAFLAEDFGRAVTHYRMALEFEDSAPDIYYNLGLAYYRVNAYRKAMESFRRSVELDPKFAAAHHNLALAYDKLYDMDAANRHFNEYRSLVVGKADHQSGGIAGNNAGINGSGRPGANRPGGKQSRKNTAQARVPSRPAAAPDQVARVAPVKRRLKKQANDPAGGLGRNEVLPNPFQGNGKWWIQDTATQNQ